MLFTHDTFTGLVGIARADITPPVGIYCRSWGAASHDTARGIHRPLSLTAVAFQEAGGGPPLVLIDADLGWWISLNLEREFRAEVLAALGLPAERLLFCLTHTHSAPPLSPPEPHWPGGDLLTAYLAALRPTTVATARRAIEAMEPATVEWHRGRCVLAADRDLPDPTRSAAEPRLVVGFHPGPAAEDTLVVGRITAAAGTPRGAIANYACHPTTLAWENDRVSPDFVGAFRETVEQAGGGTAVFLQGASGELGPRVPHNGATAVAHPHGPEIGLATLATLAAMEPPGTALAFAGIVESGAPLATWRREPRSPSPLSRSLAAIRRTVELPLKDWPPAAELAAQFAACTDRPVAERLRRKLRIREVLGDSDSFPLELWGWRLGEAIVLGTMAEAYATIQQQVRAALPGRTVVWLNLVNGSIGYLPPRPLYDVDIYQVWQTPFSRGSLERVTQAAIDLGRELLAS